MRKTKNVAPIEIEENQNGEAILINAREKQEENFKAPDLTTTVSITIPQKADFYKDDIEEAKANEYRDIEQNTESKLFKSKEKRIKERKLIADSK